MAEKNGMPGSLARLSKKAGILFSIKQEQSGFAVDELPLMPEFSENGGHCYFWLAKKGLATQEALGALAAALGIPPSRFSAAGQKDRQAGTRQLASVFGVDRKRLEGARLPPSISVSFAGYSHQKLAMGNLAGNRFRIRAYGLADGKKAKKAVDGIAKGNDFSFPNYFGGQRFGQRENTHEVGRLLLQGRTQDAAEKYLAECSENESGEKTAARGKLAENFDFAAALSYFPHSLSYERTMLGVLSREPANFTKAFLRLPRPILLLFVHAYQSHLFNLHLSGRIRGGTFACVGKHDGEKIFFTNAMGFPDENSAGGKKWLALQLLGTGSRLNDYEKELLDREEVRLPDFAVRQMPMLGTKGGWRSALAPMKDFEFDGEWFSFSLPPGCYATAALREFLC